MLDSTLLGIASELLVEILQHLDYLSLLRCQQVYGLTDSIQTCLRLCRLIRLDSKLQYILELDIYRLQENNISGPYSERLAYLRRYRQKWECLDFSRAVSVPTDPTSMAYDFAEGIYSQLMQSGDVVIHQIPSALDPAFVVQRRNIFKDTNRTVGTPHTSSPKDFAVDPSQNLIIWYERINDARGVLGQLTFYFHCLDNIGVVHPEANGSTWVTDIDKRTISSFRHDTIVWMDAELRVFQDLLAIHIEVDSWPQDDRPVGIILIWNWKIGRVVFDSRVFPLARNPSKHALLGRDILLVTSVEDSGSLALYGFQPTSNHGYPRLLALFRFPPLQAWCTLSSTHVQTPHCCENATAAFKPVFHESIISVTLTYLKETAVLERASYSLFVHLSSLLSYSTCGYERYVFWEDWGPKHTRLLPKITPGVWVKFMHGQMVAGTRKHISRSLAMLDFSPHPREVADDDLTTSRAEAHLYHFIYDENETWEHGTLYGGYIGRNHPTVYSQLNGFESDVTTSLPFRFTVRKPQEDVSARWFLLDGERLIASVTQNGIAQEALQTFII